MRQGLDVKPLTQFTNRSGGRVIGLLLMATGLAACGQTHNIEVGSIPDDYRTNHPIIVSEREQTMDIPVASSDRSLTVATRGAIRGFAQRYQTGASGAIQIVRPEGSVNSGAAGVLVDQVRAELAAQGVPHHRIIETRYAADASGDAAPIRLSYFAIDASTGECGRWPEDIFANGHENRHYANFGCATQNNLAAQIADPMDLIAPRGSTPIDAGRRDQVFRDYQTFGAGL